MLSSRLLFLYNDYSHHSCPQSAPTSPNAQLAVQSYQTVMTRKPQNKRKQGPHSTVLVEIIALPLHLQYYHTLIILYDTILCRILISRIFLKKVELGYKSDLKFESCSSSHLLGRQTPTDRLSLHYFWHRISQQTNRQKIDTYLQF